MLCLVEPLSPLLLNHVLGEIVLGVKSNESSECNILAAAALAPGIIKHGKVIDINHLHVSLGHAHAEVLRETAKQHGIRLTGELVSCRACSRAKGQRTYTPHRTTGHATRPMDLFQIDTAGPYSVSLGGSQYDIMFVGSASHLQWSYEAHEKSESAILAVVKRSVVDMGVPRVFRTDNGTEYTNGMVMDYCSSIGIRRRFTAPRTPQQNGPAETAITGAFKAGHAARLGVHHRLEETRGCTDPVGISVWLESLLWGSECFNRAASSVHDE